MNPRQRQRQATSAAASHPPFTFGRFLRSMAGTEDTPTSELHPTTYIDYNSGGGSGNGGVLYQEKYMGVMIRALPHGEGFLVGSDKESVFDSVKDARTFIKTGISRGMRMNPKKRGSKRERGIPEIPAGTHVFVNNLHHLNRGAVVVDWHRDVDVYGKSRAALLRLDPVYRLDGTQVFAAREAIVPHFEIWLHKRHSNPNDGDNGENVNDGNDGSAADGAAAIHEEFTGHPSSYITEYAEKVHYPEHLGELANLAALVVETPSGYEAEIEFAEEGEDVVKLACTPDGLQLYFLGGDQSLDLASLHMDGDKWVKEQMVIGDVTFIDYYARKAYDGDEEVYYWHEVGEDLKNGKRRIVPHMKPALLYFPKDERMELAGGTYYITKEGIRS